MKKVRRHKENERETGQLTEPMDISSDDFTDFRHFILSKSKSRTKEQKILVEVMALKYRMEDYLASEQKQEISIGEFLRTLLKVTNIRQNRFAEYIGMRPTNFNKLLRGERRMSLEQAMIMESIFDIEPETWIGIQTKNDLRKLSKVKKQEYSNYNLKELIEK